MSAAPHASPPAARPARPRRTQEQRSAETQAKVMDAAIECLLEVGYGETTTQMVAKRAGVTRGALLHHYPSREDLVAGAVRYLAVKRTEEALRTFARLTQGESLIPDALDLLWALYQGPLFTAAIELLVASRTDPALARQVEAVEEVVFSSIKAAGSAMALSGISAESFNELVVTAMDAITGLLIRCYPARDSDRPERAWARLRTHLLVLAHAQVGRAAHAG
ncbi:TetR/AcrR family transcriptional regulator [Nocardia farcinica]|uniref:TetR/AcrR family transcriptional regulator n=1 Tax=Nocardia farcinica TaxID=37329 RepID=UPI001895549C|nr:TetR/AcrR family transcriptional regulator [Nocardia farcinica]MBF6295278.1 TetR/AcrR family transcriptional regulator [Nocardia farcinica]MBF6381862.1 TetR/AcrR family transcriptional regulator [Nocardia farcinica]